MPTNKKIFLAALSAYALAVIFSFAQQYYINYSKSDGLLLANGAEVGGDFLTFYVAGKIVNTDISRLYDFEFQRQNQLQLFDLISHKLAYLPFVYPPLVAWFFSLFSKLTLYQAYLSWLALSLLLLALAVTVITKTLQFSLSKVLLSMLLILSFVPLLVDCLAAGQLSILGLLIYALVFFFLSKRMDFLAGVVFAFGYYKPPLFLFFFLSMLVLRQFKFVVGALSAAVVLSSLTVYLVGFEGLLNYLQVASSYTYGNELFKGIELPPNLGVGVYAILNQLLGVATFSTKAAYLIIWASLLLFFWRLVPVSYRSSASSSQMVFAGQAACAVLVSPQVLSYDLSLLLVPLVIFLSFYQPSKIYFCGLIAAAILYFEWFARAEVESDVILARSGLLLLTLVLLLNIRKYVALK